jgi:CDP-diacylglycerol--glycerol-3-phosphate 3-phosphatidyltransferase
MLSHYRAPLQTVADPVARLLSRAHLRPNQLTVLGLGVSVAAAHEFFQGRFRVGAMLLVVAGLFDFFDGALARLAGVESAFGAFLDSVVDRYSDLLVLFGIVMFYERADDGVGVFFTMITAIGTVMVSYTKARAQSIGIPCEIGLMERPERMIVLIGGGLFHLLTPALVALAVLTNVTAVQRILHVRRLVRESAGR